MTATKKTESFGEKWCGPPLNGCHSEKRDLENDSGFEDGGRKTVKWEVLHG